MASSAVKLIFDNNNLDLNKIRMLLGGTETGVDHSKAISSYVFGALKQAGICLGNNFLTFQVQHACAGAAISLHTVASILSHSNNSEYGIVFLQILRIIAILLQPRLPKELVQLQFWLKKIQSYSLLIYLNLEFIPMMLMIFLDLLEVLKLRCGVNIQLNVTIMQTKML